MYVFWVNFHWDLFLRASNKNSIGSGFLISVFSCDLKEQFEAGRDLAVCDPIYIYTHWKASWFRPKFFRCASCI